MNRKSRKDEEIQVELSVKLSREDEVNVKVSGKLSEQMRRWLIPTLSSVLVTFVAAILPHLRTPQPSTPPILPPAVDVQSK